MAAGEEVTTDRKDPVTDSDASSLSSDEAQAGVKGIEAISSTWTSRSLLAAYIGIFLIANSYSFENQTTGNLTPYATSAFQKHSLLSTIYVVQAAINAAVKPPMAKIANVFGRLEAFSLSVLFYVLGYIQQASSKNIQTFASAQIFYSAGFTGLLILNQIFIADTSDLKWRTLLSSLPDVPFLWTTWIGPEIAKRLVTNWRWGYGLWAIVLPIAFLPLGVTLLINMQKAKRLGILPPRPWKGQSFGAALKKLYFELDVVGLLLLIAAITMILVPLTLAPTAGWSNPSIVATITIGCICFVVFPLWESQKKLAPYPFLALSVLMKRNVAIGCASGLFYFAVYYTSVYPYFNSYLQVVQYQSVDTAGRITQTFSFASTVTVVLVGVVIRMVKRFKYFVVGGAALYLMGIGLMIRYRSENSTVGQNVGAQIVVGIGGGLFNLPMQLAVQSAVPHQDVAAATAIYLTFIEIGGAIGSAISGAVWGESLPKKLATYLPAATAGNATLIYGNITLAQSFPAGSPERIAINRSYQETMDTLLTIAISFAAPVFLLSLLLKDTKLDMVDQRVKGRVIGSSDTPPEYRDD